MVSVLVTDARQRKAVPIIRSLGRRGIPVLAGDDSRFSMGFFSKYCTKSYIYPAPDEHPQQFLDWLLREARRGTFQVLFAIDERTLDVITRHRRELLPHVAVPSVDFATYSLARDKAKTLALANSLGIPCPRTAVVGSLGELTEIAQTWEFPLIIKPRTSQGSRGLRLVSSPAALRSVYSRVAQAYPVPLVQEYIPPGGDALGVGVLLNYRSEPRGTFVHRRLREYPVSGGPSTLRVSVAAPELVDMGVKLLRAMDWQGVAMVEFKMDPRDGLPKLMEVNPKFWGSIALSIAAGVDFPYLLYRLATGGDVPSTNSYQTGVLCRWLIPGDILHFLFNPQRFPLRPSFFQFRRGNLHYDLLDRDDPGPLWGMFCAALTSLTQLDFWKKHLSPCRH
jgi:predicted ATP-grasp superfamily ATP-dependent carboligase